MKRILLVLVVVLVAGVAVWLHMEWAVNWVRARLAPASTELRASQQDEDAAPAPDLALSVLVNGQAETVVARGGPLLVTVAATQRHAVNVEAKLRLLQAREARLAARAQRQPPDEQALQRTRGAIAALQQAVRLKLGAAASPWTQAVQVSLRPLAARDPQPWTLRVLASQASPGAGGSVQPGVAVLDAESSAEVHLVPEPGPWAAMPAGQYEARACLVASGDWHGRACSDPVRLTLVSSEAALTPAQRDAVDRHAARVALLAHDWGELERRGRALLARDKLAGHNALGDACFGQQNWDQALAEYSAARAAWPKNREFPRALDLRITRLLEMLTRDE